MDIYDNDTNQSHQYKEKVSKHGFFERSELNDWTPLWEKIAFFLLGFLGIKLYSLIVVRIIYITPLVTVTENGYVISTLGETLANFLVYLLLVLSFLGFIFFDRRKTYKRIFIDFKNPVTYIWGFVGFALVLAFQLALGNLFTATIPFYGSNSNQSSIETMTSSYPVMLFIMTVFFAPFVEELTYRCGLIDTIGHNYKFRWLGIILSGLIFGLIHADLITPYSELMYAYSENATNEVITQLRYSLYNELLNLPIYVGSGIFLGLTYAKSGKIASSMVAHFGVNLFSMVVSFIQLNFGK